MKQLLIVGQGPSSRHQSEKALDGFGTGDKLAALFGMERDELLKRCDSVNLLDKYYGKNGRGDIFPLDIARESAKKIVDKRDEYQSVILLGQNVAGAFEMKGYAPFQWYTVGKTRIAIIPHMAGANRWYAKEQNIKVASEFLRAIFSNGHAEILPPVSKALKISRQERAQECTAYLQAFESATQSWADLGEKLVECEKDELYLELGCETWDEWAQKFAPKSYRLCYIVKSRFKNLSSEFSLKELREMPPETAQYAARHVSPAARKNPEIREALKLPRKKAVEALKEAAPEQHFEDVKKRLLKFSESQHAIVDDGYEAYKFSQSDEKVSFEDFTEFLVNNWLDSAAENGKTLRENWELHKAEITARELGVEA
jgi:hypothetical protein